MTYWPLLVAFGLGVAVTVGVVVACVRVASGLGLVRKPEEISAMRGEIEKLRERSTECELAIRNLHEDVRARQIDRPPAVPAGMNPEIMGEMPELVR